MTRLRRDADDDTTVVLDRPDVVAPEGYSTLWYWWCANEPAALELLVQPLQTIREDTLTLIDYCDRHGVHYHTVTASPPFRKLGYKTAPAFPLWLIERHYPVQP